MNFTRHRSVAAFVSLFFTPAVSATVAQTSTPQAVAPPAAVQNPLVKEAQQLAEAIELTSPAMKDQARTAAVSYAFESRAADAGKYYEQVFNDRVAAASFNGAAGTANAMARMYLESGDPSERGEKVKAPRRRSTTTKPSRRPHTASTRPSPVSGQ